LKSLTELGRRRIASVEARGARAIQQAKLAESRAVDAERRLSDVLHSKAWRVTWPLRYLSTILHGAGSSSPAAPQAGGPSGSATSAPALPLALLVDDNWPRPDRDAGSIEIVNLAETLRWLGFDVRMVVDESRSGLSAADASSARDALRASGIVPMAFPDDAALDAFLRGEGRSSRLIVLCRVYCGGGQFERVRRICYDARIVFNTIDLHYVRIAREAAMTGDPMLETAAVTTRLREEFLAREADATLVVSEKERETLEASVPQANVFALPLARPLQPPVTPFAGRGGIGFIGGFAHAPNLDAVRFFLDQIWPLVLQDWPDCRFSIVGADLPVAELGGRPGQVEYLGAVPDVGPWFESLLLTVAPLRYGAGVKGKVVSSLAAGVPCVTTSIAAEGMGLQDGVDSLLADDPSEIASQILRLRADPALWARLSTGGMAHVAAAFSPDDWRARLRDALWTIDALPAGGPLAVPDLTHNGLGDSSR